MVVKLLLIGRDSTVPPWDSFWQSEEGTLQETDAPGLQSGPWLTGRLGEVGTERVRMYVCHNYGDEFPNTHHM